MAFNKDNYDVAPFANGIMTLTHEECVYVIEKTNEVRETYIPEENFLDIASYTISNYNKIDNWEKAINGDTYNCLQGYNIEENKYGINTYGIIYEAPEVEEAPVKEVE